MPDVRWVTYICGALNWVGRRWKNPVVRYRTGDVGSIVPIDVELAKKAGVDPGAYKVLQYATKVILRNILTVVQIQESRLVVVSDCL